MTRRLHMAMLRAASRLVPRGDRAEWLDEWRAELWYVERAGGAGTAFCRGAFRDAWWLCRSSLNPAVRRTVRLETPLKCLLVLAAMAVACLLVSRSFWVHLKYRDPRSLAMVSAGTASPYVSPSVSIENFRRMKDDNGRKFTDLAYYSPGWMNVQAGKTRVRLRGATATPNLFRLLGVPVGADGRGPILVVERGKLRDLVGRAVEVDGRRAVVAVIPEGSWQLPGALQAWLLDDSAVGGFSRGFVVGRAGVPMHRPYQSFLVANDEGHLNRFEFRPLEEAPPFDGILVMMLLSCLALPGTIRSGMGRTTRSSALPLMVRMRRWLFLAAKLLLALTSAICSVMTLSMTWVSPLVGNLLLLGCIVTIRWVILDNQRRCPVCLCLLANPVQIGRPSQTFLEWYGTELMCTRGCGLMHVCESSTSSLVRRQWHSLDGSWSGLFSNAAR